MSDRKVMVIGLDAATLDLVRPWADEGLLPNLRQVMDRGAAGPLRTTLPIHSSAAWSSFATGTNPGKHGIADFLQFTPDSYKPSFTNASQRRGETFWEVAGRQGVRGGVINVPVTYPPRAYNGFIISGLLSPGVSRRIAQPPEVFDDLLASSRDYAIDVDMLKAGGRDVRLAFLARTLSIIQARLAAAVGLYRKYRPPLFCVVFRAADQACHYFWRDFERAQAGEETGPAERRLGQAIKAVYQKLDQAVGTLVAEADSQTDVLILSDHGAGPLRKGLNMQEFLARSGLLVRKAPSPASRLLRKAIWAFVHLAPLSLKNLLKTRFTGLARRAAGKVTGYGIDFARSRAYPACDSEGIFINLKGRQPLGTVAPGDYEAVRDEVIHALAELTDPETGLKVVANVFRREEVWSGPCLERLPDLVFEQREKVYYTPPTSVSSGSVFYPLPASTPSALRWSGDHRRQGLVMAVGPHIRHAEIRGAEIVDVPATILALLGCSIPEDFDGRILSEILTDDVQAPGKIAADQAGSRSAEVYSEQDRAVLKQRLQGLGYI